MNTILKRVISLVLCFVLVTGCLPASAFATENGEMVTTETTEVTTEPTQTASEETEAPSESTDVTEPSSEATEPSKEATEPSKEATVPSTEATEPYTEATEPAVIAVTGITLDKTAVEVGVGEVPMTLTATVQPENATDKTVTWTSSEPGVVSVDNGVLTFGYMGEAVVTATAGDFSASCTVIVGEGVWSDYAGDGVVVIAASDFQLSDSGTIMTNIMNQIKEEYGSAYGVLMGGDYDAGAVNTTASHIKTVDNTISGVFSEIASENRVYIQGNHENFAGLKPDGNNLLTTEHVRDTEYYGVYAINHDDFPWTTSTNPSPSEALVKKTAEDLGNYLEAKIATGYSKPVFVLSHLPLHATTRGDNRYAKLIFDELEAAGEAGLNIIFLVGHNHSGGYDQYLGNGSFYLPEGSSLTVVEGTSGKYTDSSISFTYMNYGYLGRFSGSACTHQTMTAFAITDDQVTVKRYDEDGAHKLKAAGVAVSGYTTDSTVIGTDGATITLSTPTVEETVEQSHNNVTVVAPGLTGLTVEKKFGTDSETGYDKETYAAYASYEISPVGYEQGKYATVTITLDEVDGFDASRKVVVIDVDGNTESEKSIVNGTVTFTTNHFSTYDIGQKAVPASSGYTYELVTSIESGEQYVIVGNDHSVALMDNSGSIGSQNVTIEGTTLISDVALTEWTFSSASSGTITSGNGNKLGYSSSNWNLTGSGDCTFDIGTGSNNFSLHVVRSNSYSNRYYFYYDGSDWAKNSSSAQYVRLYKLAGTASGGGSTVTPVVKDWVTISSGVGGTIYTLDTDGVTTGEDYLIVSTGTDGTAQALRNNNGTVSSAEVTIANGQIVTDATDIVWTYDSDKYLSNGSHFFYLSHSNANSFLSTSEKRAMAITSNNAAEGAYTVKRDGNYYNYYLNYNNGEWTNGNTAGVIYFFVESGTESAGDAEYAKMVEADGTDDFSFTVPYGADSNTALGIVKAGIDVLTSTSADGSDPTTQDDNNTDIRWELATSYDGKTPGEYAVKVYYKDKYLGTAKVVVPNIGIEADDILYYIDDAKSTSINVTLVEGTVTGGTFAYEVVEGGDAITSSIAADGTITFAGTEGTAQVKITYTYTEGETAVTLEKVINVTAKNPYYTVELCNPTVDDEGNTTYVPIEKPLALKSIETGDTYSVWAVVKEYNSENPDGLDLGDLEDNKLRWSVSDTSIATIDSATGVITFTGTNYGTFELTVYYLGADGNPLCRDTIIISASESQYVVPGDGTDDFPEYPNQGAVRFDKTATAVGNYSETGIAMVELSMTGVPYGSSVPTDVVIMMDMTTSMYHYGYIDDADAAIKNMLEALVYDAENDKFDSNIYVQVWSFKSDDDGEDVAFVENLSRRNITTAAELTAAKAAIAFDTDGNDGSGTCYDEGTKKMYEIVNGCTTENVVAVFASDGGPSRYTYLDGEVPNEISGTNASVGQDTWFNDDGSVTEDYLTEYYTYLLKGQGIPVYTVGIGIDANTPEAHVLEHMSSEYDATGMLISTAPANATTTYFATADINTTPDVLSTVFTGIAASIREAATDVEVEDKVGNNYTLNFSMPVGVSADATDNLTEFYIQAVEYQLNENKERTGDPIVLENFTFYANGTFKSHTVNGVACAGCDHVTFFTNKITGIDGTYFDYTCKPALDDNGAEIKNAAGNTITEEFLTWKAEKLTTTELALQYFAHLDGSTGESAGSMPAGTYYTNEYASLTYKNYQGNEVQQKFPVPQMTWNGAQVSYTFYLVNEKGQPVNRAGRVVPFAEAVYVTDVYTEHVIWNDLEQSAGLEAKYLAEEIVPDVYSLYDDNASYNIHVYEDESAVNLNNHFIIGGDVTDAYNTEKNWTNANTTFVFNVKSDVYKYNTVGAYIANDGNDEVDSKSYYCKSAAIEGANYTTSVDEAGVTVYTVTGLGSGYQSVSGETQVQASVLPSTTGGTIIDGYIYYVDENGAVYTIVQKSNGTEVHKGFDFHNTTVAFAVVWKPQLEPDTVVVDYGLDVVIDVITNDGMAAGVKEVQTTQPDAEINRGTYKRNDELTTSVEVKIDEMKIGTAKVENLNSVRFSLDKNNGMQFTDPAVFYYEADVNYYTYDSSNNATLNTTSMYSSVTVIPATTVYYEDEYVTLNTYRLTFTEVAAGAEFSETTTYYIKNASGTYVKQRDLTEFAEKTTYYTASENYEKAAGWDTNSVKATATQQQDRPGESKISEALDADNVYGHDSAYKTMSTHSLGSAAMVHVDANSYATAEFSFYGTGFDVISMTSNTTGTLLVRVYDAEGNRVRNTVVDTFYGMDKDGTLSANDPEAIYQVPVIKIFDLAYGKYTVSITATYGEIFDHTTEDGYDLYLDAIRIYDPTGNQDTTANDAYVADGEGWPTYVELRDKVINTDKFFTAVHTAINTDEFFTKAEIAGFENGIAYYTKDEEGKYSKAAGEFNADLTYYVINANKLVAENGSVKFKDGDTYYTKDETGKYSKAADEFDTDLTYYVTDAGKLVVENGSVKFKDGVTYYTKDEKGKYSKASGEFNADLTYYVVNEDAAIYGEGGALFIDCNNAATSIADYVSYGPNNELYLANGQAIAFKVTDTNIADIQLGIKVANGDSVTYKINGDSYTVNTTTDMYYSILDYAKNSQVVTIKNVSGGILSLTNIKVTHTSAPATESGISLLSMDGESAGIALMMLRRAPVVEEEVPETNAPDVPETTAPEETEPADPDNSELKSAVEDAKDLKEKDYTRDSYKAMKSALKSAEKVLKDKNATQAEIDAALEALNAAVEALEAKPDSSELKATVKAAKKLKEKDYTKDSYKAVKSALKSAEKVLKDKNATQAEIDAALEALNAAVEALEAKPDNSELKAAVKAAKKLKEKDYTKDSYKAVKSAINAAEKVLKDKNASQAEIDTALAELNEAVAALEANASKAKPGKKNR